VTAEKRLHIIVMKRRKTMDKILEMFLCIMGLVLVFALAGEAWGEVRHPYDLDAYPTMLAAPCNDHESGEAGFCRLVEGPDTVYLLFYQDNEVVLMRRLRDEGGYDQIWTRRPPGVAL
jgi:hypothetical protein